MLAVVSIDSRFFPSSKIDETWSLGRGSKRRSNERCSATRRQSRENALSRFQLSGHPCVRSTHIVAVAGELERVPDQRVARVDGLLEVRREQDLVQALAEPRRLSSERAEAPVEPLSSLAPSAGRARTGSGGRAGSRRPAPWSGGGARRGVRAAAASSANASRRRRRRSTARRARRGRSRAGPASARALPRCGAAARGRTRRPRPAPSGRPSPRPAGARATARASRRPASPPRRRRRRRGRTTTASRRARVRRRARPPRLRVAAATRASPRRPAPHRRPG
jgi:hypothetical protein